MERASLYCQRRFSKENVLTRLSFYTTRVLVALVWCAVLWAFLTTGALPRQYVEFLMSRDPGPCIQSAEEIPAQYEDQLLGLLPASWNGSLLSDYQVLALSNDGTDNTSFQVILVKQSSLCLNILQLRGFVVLTPNSSDGSGDDAFTTDSLATATVDVQELLYPESSSSLLDIPTGHFFALALLLVVSAASGVLAKWLLLPQLVGMIIAGFVLRNVPGIDFARQISNPWSSAIRNVALVIVLTRGGLSMDFKQLKRLKVALLLLAFVPCVLEGAVDGLLATFWLGLPWQFAFTLGYIVAAISPAVVVPTTLSLQDMGYGVESGIPTLIVGAASMDVVISISLFGIFLGLAFSDGSLVVDIVRAPIQIIVGILYGVVFGLLLWIFPTKQFKAASKVRNRFFLTLGLGLFSLFGSTRAFIGGSNLAGSGALGALVVAFVAGQGWNKEEKDLVLGAFYLVWQFFEPLLFGLIGAAVDLQFISSSLVGQAIGLILVGLTVRISSSYVVILGNGFSWLEMCFVSVAWLPKATVQAAIGSLALDTALTMNDEANIEFGRQILTVAVLAVVMTAPLGALATSILGPVLLKKKQSEDGPEAVKTEQLQESEEKLEDVIVPVESNKDSKSGTCEVNSVTPPDPPLASRTLVEDPLPNSSNEVELVVIKDLDSEPRTY